MPAAESALSTTALATLAQRFRVSVDDLAAAIETDPELAGYAADQVASFYGFTPRPDRPELFDQQTSYVEANDVVSFFVAGNGSGKTSASAYKCAQFLLHKQPPPRKDTPFWVITNTMQVAGEVLWKEKLLGEGHLPGCEIDWSRVSWANMKANHPSMVPLLPWPEERGGKPDCNWQIEFKSFEMGRQSLQSASIGGFWFSEQFPVGLFTETMVRCRDYLFPGGQFAEFTPLEPDLCVWLEQLLEEVPSGWGFYRGNTECNRENLAPNAIEAFMATVPDELIGTRLRGDLATFEGAIYPGFNVAVHVVPDDLLRKIPSGCWHAMGTDWGSSVEHPHVTIFGCIDAVGDWWIYDEYWDCTQTKTTFERAQDIVAKCGAWGWPITRGRAEGRELLKLSSVDPHYGLNFADPSRPGEINAFSMYGIPTLPAVNRVYDGINLVRSLLKIQPTSGRPRLFIAKRCKHLIDELRKYRWRKSRKPTEGNFLNPTAAAPVPLKREDDACFPAETAVSSPTGDIPIWRVCPGDQVLTHRGIATVFGAGCTGENPLVKLTLSDGRTLRCTATHRLAKSSGGWIEACQSQGHQLDCLDPSSLIRRDADRSSAFLTAVTFGIDIQPTRRIPIAATFVGAHEPADSSRRLSSRSSYISRCGSIITDLSRKERIYTTATKTLEITSPGISNCSPSRSTENSILQRKRLGPQPPTGTRRGKELNGINSRAKALGLAGRQLRIFASAAAISTKAASRPVIDFALISAVMRHESPRALTASNENVSSAALHSRSTVTARRDAARASVRPLRVLKVEVLPESVPVYCLATSDGTFFADGVLVSNCDALRYLIASYDRGRGLSSEDVARQESGSSPARKSIQLASGSKVTQAASRGAAAVFKPTR